MYDFGNKNAFEYIAGKVEAQLAPAGYTRQKVAADDKQEIVALFTSENVAYSVVYYKEKLIWYCAPVL